MIGARTGGLLLALAIWVSTAEDLRAQSFAGRPTWATELCTAVLHSNPEATDNRYRNGLHQLLWEAAGVDGSTDPEAGTARVAAWARTQAAVPWASNGFNCSGAVPGFEGSIYELAVHQGFWFNVRRLASAGLDINLRNGATGLTVLDALHKKAEHRWIGDEHTWGPASRLTGGDFRASSLTYTDHYWRARELGARHSVELD
jgi:hypothetical protein